MVRAYSAICTRFAYWLCGDRFVAEDVVQEAFVRPRSAGIQPGQGHAQAPLLTIVRREHARLYERKRFDHVDDAPRSGVLPRTTIR